jgi:hypothetical protein
LLGASGRPRRRRLRLAGSRSGFGLRTAAISQAPGGEHPGSRAACMAVRPSYSRARASSSNPRSSRRFLFPLSKAAVPSCRKAQLACPRNCHFVAVLKTEGLGRPIPPAIAANIQGLLSTRSESLSQAPLLPPSWPARPSIAGRLRRKPVFSSFPGNQPDQKPRPPSQEKVIRRSSVKAG